MNSYTYPENTVISLAAKNLITRILNLNPTARPSLDEVLGHEFFNQGNVIPKLLPTSTLACAPSSQMLKQFSTGNQDNVNSNVNINQRPFTTRNDDNDALNNGNINDLNINNNNNNMKLIANTERMPRNEEHQNQNQNKKDN